MRQNHFERQYVGEPSGAEEEVDGNVDSGLVTPLYEEDVPIQLREAIDEESTLKHGRAQRSFLPPGLTVLVWIDWVGGFLSGLG